MIKILDLLNSVNALNGLGREKMGGKLAYKIAKGMRLVDQELKDYEVARVGLCEKLGTLDKETNQFFFGENQPEFDREIAELVQTEVEAPFLMLSLEEVEGLNVTPDTLMAIDWMIAPDEG